MKIKWLGHATFLITSDAGTKIITDPYATSSSVTYDEIKESADIVTVSHEHGDHNNVAVVGGNPAVVKGEGSKWVLPSAIFETSSVRSSIPEIDKDKKEIGYMKFDGIPTHHDEAGGSQRGNNIIFCFEVDGIRVCHLGDLGHQLDDKDVALMGRVDILLVPVGGNYTIDAKVATDVCGKLAPKVIIPMHFRNERCSNFPVAGVDDFLQGKGNVTELDTSEKEFKQGELPATTQIIVLKPAL